MEHESHTKRGRLMGKLFGRDKDRKGSEAAGGGDLNDFLHGPNDSLQVAHAAPQMLAKIDTSNARRYPNALEVHGTPQSSMTSLPLRGQSHSPRIRNKKGLVVRFVDTLPETIGEGGEQCSLPTAEIGKRRRAQSTPMPPPAQRPSPPQDVSRTRSQASKPSPDFVPPPIRRTQTGFNTMANVLPPDIPDIPAYSSIPAGNPAPAQFLDQAVVSNDDKRKSFIEIHQAEQRQAEGMAFVQAVRTASAGPDPESDWEGVNHQASGPGSPAESHVSRFRQSVPESSENQYRRPAAEQSPVSSVYSTASGPALSQRWPSVRESPGQQLEMPSSPAKRTLSVQDAGASAGDNSLDIFTSRTRHLFELFRLHAETARPILSCQPDDLARAALWWFLKGRTALESSVREQPQTPQAHVQNDAVRQQSYADLAKAFWLCEEAVPDVLATKKSPVDGEVQEVGQVVISQLRKLSMSMKRNGFLPPEEALLPQTIDKSIWVEYPSVSQDIVALLRGSSGSALAAPQHPVVSMPLLEALPLGDTIEMFCFSRYFVDVYLVEQGMETQQFYFPSFLTVTRRPTQTSVDFCIVSQNGALQLRIQSNKKAGPTWDDVKWRAERFSMEIKLPRGFALVVQCAQHDFNHLWGMQDFSAKALATLHPRKDEQAVFRSTLRGFQYFDSNPQSKSFPKEPVRSCEVGLFEKILNQGAATGPRSFHRGFRLAVVTGPGIKMLSAVNHMYMPQIPVQFGFVRGDQNEPALVLKFDDGNATGRMVMSFIDENDRHRFHSLLLGTCIHQDEQVFSEVPITGFTLSESLKSDAIRGFTKLPWSRARVINDENEGDAPQTVLAEKLRVVVDFKNGTITDRVNVAPGELKIRLHIKDNKSLAILRQPQQDLTIALSEGQVAKGIAEEMFQALQLVKGSQSVRTYSFTSLRDLHDFQQALTGFKVLYDGIAAMFAISRRRMVVPIYKKWEAGTTRLQLVKMENVIQILVFFEDFHHGESMSFTLKPTDVYESISRSGKFGLRFIDAKFPLPRMVDDNGKGADDLSFVCLDMPEIPGEHDDILILFENEEDRNELGRCLPADVKPKKF